MKNVYAWVVVGVCLVLMTGCTNEEHAQRALTAEGYTDVRFVGYDWLSCSEDDFYHTGFVATKNGVSVRGTVCSGLWFKGSTIRWK